MANTYVQAYSHLVFAVKNRQALIMKTWKDELEKYITGIVQKNGHRGLAIESMPDHVHIFIGYNLNQKIPTLVENIKTSSNAWIQKKNYSKFKFDWQKGYGAFTYAHSQIDTVAKYVLNQEAHHRKKSFRDEYIEMHNNFQIEYQNKYVFEFFDDAPYW